MLFHTFRLPLQGNPHHHRQLGFPLFFGTDSPRLAVYVLRLGRGSTPFAVYEHLEHVKRMATLQIRLALFLHCPGHFVHHVHVLRVTSMDILLFRTPLSPKQPV
jgi:hypothetical protein